jgi:hypothetical protein
MFSRSGVRLLVLGGLLAAAAAGAACSSKGAQYPEDSARYKKIDAAVESLRTAYARKDLGAMNALMLPGEPQDRLEQDIKKDFDTFEQIDLDFALDRIVIEGDDISVFLHWQGQWKRKPDSPGLRERGHGVLRWVGKQSILLQSIEGDLPFGMATRILESPTGAERRG